MYRHGPSCLEGPLSRAHPWWACPAPGGPGPEDISPPSTGPSLRGEVRLGLVLRVRGEIAAGTYDTPEKWDAALERLARRVRRA
jgi:hypothetical protein